MAQQLTPSAKAHHSARLPDPPPPHTVVLQEQSLVQTTSQLEVAQSKLQEGQDKLDAERSWLVEQQRSLANDQATLAAWRNDQVSMLHEGSQYCSASCRHRQAVMCLYGEAWRRSLDRCPQHLLASCAATLAHVSPRFVRMHLSLLAQVTPEAHTYTQGWWG